MRYALSTKGVMYWTLYLHSRGNLVARTGRLYGSTFVTGAPSVVNSTVLSEHVVSLSDVKYFVGEIRWGIIAQFRKTLDPLALYHTYAVVTASAV